MFEGKMKKSILLSVFICLSVTVCHAQDLTHPFDCYYKISFLNQTIEYGNIMLHDTIPIYDLTGKYVGDTVVLNQGEGLFPVNFKYENSNFIHDSSQKVIVTSCDGTKNFEIEKIELRTLFEEPRSMTNNGCFINFKKLIEDPEKYNVPHY